MLGKPAVKTPFCLLVFACCAACYPSVDPVDAGVLLTCDSGIYWDAGHQPTDMRDGGDVTMHPGSACLTCHYSEDVVGGKFTAAGTVFSEYHVEDGCVQRPITGGKVDILHLDGGLAVSITVDKSGNFINRTALPAQYRARVTLGGKSREMATVQTAESTGVECNSCHTAVGSQNAPGRIIWP